MADYGPGYDPIQANFVSAEDQAIGGLISLAAFAAIGIGVFLAAGATELGVTIELSNGELIYLGELTEGQAAIVRLLQSGALLGDGSPAAQLALEALVRTWALQGFTAQSLASLGIYNYLVNQSDYDAFISYLESMGADCWGDPSTGQTYCVF